MRYPFRLNPSKALIRNGVYDPGILKAVFLAGGPGSGKTYVTSRRESIIQSAQKFLKPRDMGRPSMANRSIFTCGKSGGRSCRGPPSCRPPLPWGSPTSARPSPTEGCRCSWPGSWAGCFCYPFRKESAPCTCPRSIPQRRCPSVRAFCAPWLPPTGRACVTAESALTPSILILT